MRKIEKFCGKTDNYHDVVGGIVNRYTHLVGSADLSLVSGEHFRMLCQLLNGVDVSTSVDAKRELLSQVASAIDRQADVRDEMSMMTFANDTPEARAIMESRFDSELKKLTSLEGVLKALDSGQALALLERAEEVAMSDYPATKYADVFAKMTSRSGL